MQHLVGYLRRDLSSDDTPKARRPGIQGKRSKRTLPALIEDYRQGLVPLIVPMTLLNYHLRRNPVPPALPTAGRSGEWVWEQVYLRPYPKELMLRNHV